MGKGVHEGEDRVPEAFIVEYQGFLAKVLEDMRVYRGLRSYPEYSFIPGPVYILTRKTVHATAGLVATY